DVTPEPVGGSHRRFDIDLVTSGFGAKRCQVQGLDHDISGKILVGKICNRQTDAVDGDRVAATHIAEHCGGMNGHRQSVRRSLVDGEYFATSLDNTGKH